MELVEPLLAWPLPRRPLLPPLDGGVRRADPAFVFGPLVHQVRLRLLTPVGVVAPVAEKFQVREPQGYEPPLYVR